MKTIEYVETKCKSCGLCMFIPKGSSLVRIGDHEVSKDGSAVHICMHCDARYILRRRTLKDG